MGTTDDGENNVEFARLEVTADRRLTHEMKPQTKDDILEISLAITEITKEFRVLRSRLFDDMKKKLEKETGISFAEILRHSGEES